MVLVVVQSALAQSLAIAVLMGIACLTPNLTRFALVCIGVIVSAGLLTSIWFTVMITREQWLPRGFDIAQGGGPVPVAMRVVDWTPQVVAALLIIGACGALLLQQYTTRSRQRSAITGIIGLGLAGLLTSILPWQVLVPRQTVPEWALAGSAPVLSVDPTSAQFNGSGRQPGSWAIGDAEGRLSGVPTSWYTTARLQSATLAVPGKPPLDSPSYGYSAALSTPQDSENPLTRVLRDALDVRDIDSPGPANLNRIFLMICRQPEVDARRGLSGTYAGNFIVDLTQIESAGTVPLAGGVFQDRDFRLVVDPRGAPGRVRVRAERPRVEFAKHVRPSTLRRSISTSCATARAIRRSVASAIRCLK